MKYFKIDKEYSTSEEIYLLHRSLKDNEDNDPQIWFEEISQVAGSCGITSFDGLNGMVDFLKDNDGFCEKNIKTIIDFILEYQDTTAITLFSTNNVHPDLIPIMDKLCDFKSKHIINPSSESPIKLWGFYNLKPIFYTPSTLEVKK